MVTRSGVRLDGFGILATGASSGIGLAIAEAFSKAGAAVGVDYHSDRKAAEALAARIVGSGCRAIGAAVSDEANVTRLFNDVVGAFGHIDVVVAAAGPQKDAPFANMALGDHVTGTTLFVDGGMTLYPEFRGND